MLQKYNKELEEWLVLFSSTLNEQDRRRYAAIEAAKLGHGGLQYICDLLHIDPIGQVWGAFQRLDNHK